MTTYLTFTVEANAIAAQVQISTNMSLPLPPAEAKVVTQNWALIHKAISEDLWLFKKPDSQYMTSVTSHVEVAGDPAWFSSEGV